MMKFGALIAFLAFWLLTLFCVPVAESADLRIATGSNNALAVDLYQLLRKDNDNLFFSPLSITYALTMARAGAAGQTALQMDGVLNLPAGKPAIHDALAQLMGELTAADTPITLRLANRLFGRKDYSFQQPFLTTIDEHYGGSLARLDFAGAPEEARGAINDWVADQTEQKIVDLLEPNTITEVTTLVLVNAVYFLADWQQTFEPQKTRERPFHLIDSEQIEVSFMHGSHRLTFADLDGFKVLALPYSGGKLEFVAMLPDEPAGLESLETAFTATSFAQWLTEMRLHEVHVVLPTFQFTSKLVLNDALQRLGMIDAFVASQADFHPMTGNRELFISKVVHQAYVDVNEQGTEAAAATAVVGDLGEVDSLETAEFVADRPFVFLIRHRLSGAILFIGRMLDPSP